MTGFERGSGLRSILSGLVLATSWTWCIGMYAPIVLGQLLGWPGMLAFAVPNVIGCALFGYLRSAERSRRETRDHAGAMALFSAATVAFQSFFAGWMFGPPLADALATTSVAAAALGSSGMLLTALLLALLPRHVLWPLAALGFVASLATFAFLPWGSMHGIAASGEWSGTQLLLVLPTIVFGFALSPNLDLTFHRARQEVPEGARPTNFAIFGIAFASMLALTAAYLASPQGLTLPAVRAHLAVQLVLTSALHLSELRRVGIPPSARRAFLAGAAALGIGAACLSPFRETYLRFLGLYGLLFPAYAALALRVGGPIRPRQLALLAVAVVPAVPILDRAFVDGPTLATPLAVALPLLGVALVRRTCAEDAASATP